MLDARGFSERVPYPRLLGLGPFHPRASAISKIREDHVPRGRANLHAFAKHEPLPRLFLAAFEQDTFLAGLFEFLGVQDYLAM